jgi:hypothetical protein
MAAGGGARSSRRLTTARGGPRAGSAGAAPRRGVAVLGSRPWGVRMFILTVCRTCTTTRLSRAHRGRAHWGQAAGGVR